ncbi:hypothetical protein OAM67_01060 [bacterium]|nr:hypothetical protein [bacterium]
MHYLARRTRVFEKLQPQLQQTPRLTDCAACEKNYRQVVSLSLVSESLRLYPET